MENYTKPGFVEKRTHQMEDVNKDWIELREKSKNNKWEPGYGLCYCGHTNYCECSNPESTVLIVSVNNKTIILGNKNNELKK